MKVYCYPKCSTCKKALKYLDEHGQAYEVLNIVENPPSKEMLVQIFSQTELPVKRFVNTSGMKYRELGLKDKIGDMSQEEIAGLLSSDGMLIRRPLLMTEDAVLPGFKEAEWARALGIDS